MIKHIVICDKCKKEEKMKTGARWCVIGSNEEQFNHYVLPEHWEEHGVLPKYTLCGKCSAELKCRIQDEIYKFVNWEEYNKMERDE